VGGNAVSASFEAQIAQLSHEIVAVTARATAAEKKAMQAQEEARILLRKRQATRCNTLHRTATFCNALQ